MDNDFWFKWAEDQQKEMNSEQRVGIWKIWAVFGLAVLSIFLFGPVISPDDEDSLPRRVICKVLNEVNGWECHRSKPKPDKQPGAIPKR